jgi:hypothetical protein
MAQEVAIGKRLKISKAQQNMLLAVAGASIVLGVGIVFSIWLIKYIFFNMKVIDAKDVAISEYNEVIKVTGACKTPAASSGLYSDTEIENCDPNNDPSTDENTLRYKILAEMAKNNDLESVAREGVPRCYDDNGDRMSYDYIYEQYEKAESDEIKEWWLDTIRSCSALRVIPDALPSVENDEALLASLNQLFIYSGWEPESLSRGQNEEISEELIIEGLNTIPVSLSLKTNSRTILNVLGKIERSIREFAINKASVKWESEGTLELEADAMAYYIDPTTIEEETREVRASSGRRSQ